MDSAWLTGGRGRALALCLTVLVLAAAWVGAVQPLLAWHADRADMLLRRRAVAERMRDLGATLPSLRRQAEQGAGPAPVRATLEGATDAVAGAALQERMQAMAADAGASLTSIETLPAEQAGAWRRIGLRVALAAPWPVLVRLLEAIDAATPRMLVDDLHVHSTLVVRDPVALPLQTSFTVYAFRPGDQPAAVRR
jgi:general secretion pathway protein M